jgi:hypothetical protein
MYLSASATCKAESEDSLAFGGIEQQFEISHSFRGILPNALPMQQTPPRAELGCCMILIRRRPEISRSFNVITVTPLPFCKRLPYKLRFRIIPVRRKLVLSGCLKLLCYDSGPTHQTPTEMESSHWQRVCNSGLLQ